MGTKGRHPMTNSLDLAAQWHFPDTEVSTAALRLLYEVSPQFVANHTVRSYVFGRELAAAKGLRSGTDYDDETVFLSSVLHDLGLTEYGGGDQRFEVDGADAAARFLREHGVAEGKVTTIWQAIAVHTSLGLAHRFGPDHSVTHFGISLDIDGNEKGLLPPGFADRVHEAWPRHNLDYAIADLIAHGIHVNPRKGPPFTFPAHVYHLRGGTQLTFLDVINNSGWGDQPTC